MRFKGTAVLFVLLILLGGWVYFTEIRGREEREAAEEAAGRVLPLEPDEISEIDLRYPDRTLSARREGSGWTFLMPAGLEADSAAWDTVASNVGRIERGETVAETPADLAAYGLAEPEVGVEVVLGEDEHRDEILFGNANPSGESYYTRLGSSPAVFLTASTWRGLFDKQANDLRDKTLLRFDQDAVDRIEVAPSGLTLTRQEGSWFLDGPPRLRADDGEVASFLSSLAVTRATGFAGADAPDPDGVVIRLHDTGSAADHVLAFGEEAPDNAGQIYARDRSRDPVFLVSTSLRDRALAPASEWRDKTIAEIDPATVTSIRVERPGVADLVLTRSGETWSLGDGRGVNASRAEAMLSAFDFQKASEVIDDVGAPSTYGLDPPALRIVFAGDDGNVLDFAFGSESPDGSGVYWKAADQTAVKVVPRFVRTPFEVEEADLVDAAP